MPDPAEHSIGERDEADKGEHHRAHRDRDLDAGQRAVRRGHDDVASLLGAGYLPYLLAASFMAAPGGLLMAKIIMPDDLAPRDGELPLADGVAEEEQVIRAADHDLEEEKAANIIMAASNGALTGVKIAVAVGAMVLAFVSLVALANGLLGGVGHALVWVAQQISPAAGAWAQTWLGDLSFQKIVGSILRPVVWLVGIAGHV